MPLRKLKVNHLFAGEVNKVRIESRELQLKYRDLPQKEAHFKVIENSNQYLMGKIQFIVIFVIIFLSSKVKSSFRSIVFHCKNYYNKKMNSSPTNSTDIGRCCIRANETTLCLIHLAAYCLC